MLIEFGNYLKFLWGHSIVAPGVVANADAFDLSRFFTLNQLELPSKIFDSHAASPICFKIAKELAVSAELLADLLVSGGNSIFGSRCGFFSGGGGYLNGKFQPPFLTEFVCSFGGTDIKRFLSGTALTASDILAGQEDPFCELRTQLSPRSLDQLLEAGDPDVDPGVGYFSWYYNKFKHDLERLQAIIAAASANLGGESCHWHEQRLFAPMFGAVRSFRYPFLSKLTTGRHELAVVECRNLINSFYAVFNHPSIRNISGLGLNVEGLQRFAEFSRSYGELVDNALQLASGTISR